MPQKSRLTTRLTGLFFGKDGCCFWIAARAAAFMAGGADPSVLQEEGMADSSRRSAARRSEPAIPVKERERRSNVDRSAATRRQIFEATVRCLTSGGYGAVTNIRVAEEAGVSRGAMMHHFPTQQDLIVATIEYAYQKLSNYRMEVLSKLDPGLPRYRALIDLAWATAQMPEGIACNEVRHGSRSDPQIRVAVTPIMTRLSDDYGRLHMRLAREAGLESNAEVQGLTATTAMTMRSLAVNTFTYPRSQMVENVLLTLKTAREDIIARQLGEHVAQRPRLPESPRPAARRGKAPAR
jgi:AcrR family transcriptional regulator